MQTETLSFSKTQTWRRHYADGVPFKINPLAYHSLVDLFEQSINKYRLLPAYECMGTCITFGQLDLLSRNFAAYLQNDLELSPGTKVAIQMPNLLQYPIALFGVLRAGMVVVNTNPLYTPREMKHQFVDSETEVVIILANFAHNLEEIIKDTAIKHVIITELGDQLRGVKRVIVNKVVKHVKKMVPKYSLPGAVSFNKALKCGEQHSFQAVSIKGKDTAFLQYTGGTTGISKGAVLSHTNVVANIEQFTAWITSSKLREGKEIIITALPLYHILALVANCLSMLKMGAKNVLIPNPRDMKGFVKELKKHPFSIFSGVNTLYNGLLNEPDFHKVDFSNLKLCGSGGMAVQTVTAERWKKVTNVPISEGYGLTETSPILTFNVLVDGKERIGTIGIPLPSTSLKIADDNEQEVVDGTPGEIYAKGPQVMHEYFNRPDETSKVFTGDGWFKTGDIGVKDEDGFFRIVDRKKEMILVSGFNVYPNEIENIVSQHAKVAEVAAIGVHDEKSTEAVKIFVVKSDASLTKEEILEHCRKNLTAYKVPKHIEFRDTLPKSNVGKILRRMLKEE
ncbi:AMP-binding protein [Fulvivirga ligni]|uniref:AMP-binding protein n=1 Tax=Fulvivirga ligni TaxID=2904246 RepID=UPI001F1B9E89|nr:AMP-binding protein [Fulvivirga ligni]UII19317.1 AMP-binding protein [Fulvivirga ligni]